MDFIDAEYDLLCWCAYISVIILAIDWNYNFESVFISSDFIVIFVIIQVITWSMTMYSDFKLISAKLIFLDVTKKGLPTVQARHGHSRKSLEVFSH